MLIEIYAKPFSGNENVNRLLVGQKFLRSLEALWFRELRIGFVEKLNLIC